MLGVIIVDIVRSVYDCDNIRTKDFQLFSKKCVFTDDTETIIREYLDENFNGDNINHAMFRYLYNDDEDENPLGEAIIRDALGLPPDFDFDDLDEDCEDGNDDVC